MRRLPLRLKEELMTLLIGEGDYLCLDTWTVAWPYALSLAVVKWLGIKI